MQRHILNIHTQNINQFVIRNKQISIRWYRAPECLLNNGYNDEKMDLRGVGCVIFEIIDLFHLIPGTNKLDQIYKIHNILGTFKQINDVARNQKENNTIQNY